MKPLLSILSKRAVLAAVLAAAFTLPNIASAQFILDTGVPNGGTGTFVLNSSSSLAGEFAATTNETITQLSAYLTQGVSQSGTSFIFDIYSSLRTTGNRVSPVFTTTATYTGTGWNVANVNWTPTANGDYWLALQTSSGNSFDATGEASNSTGTLPAIAFAASSNSNDYYTVSTTSPIGLEITATPEPSSWALGFLALGLAFYLRRHALRAESLRI